MHGELRIDFSVVSFFGNARAILNTESGFQKLCKNATLMDNWLALKSLTMGKTIITLHPEFSSNRC